MMIVYRMSLFGYFQTSFVETIRNPKFSFYQLKNTPRDVSHMMWLRGRYQTSADRAVRIPSGFTVRYLSDIIENLKFSVEGFRVSGFRIWTWFWPTVCQTPHSKSGQRCPPTSGRYLDMAQVIEGGIFHLKSYALDFEMAQNSKHSKPRHLKISCIWLHVKHFWGRIPSPMTFWAMPRYPRINEIFYLGKFFCKFSPFDARINKNCGTYWRSSVHQKRRWCPPVTVSEHHVTTTRLHAPPWTMKHKLCCISYLKATCCVLFFHMLW